MATMMFNLSVVQNKNRRNATEIRMTIKREKRGNQRRRNVRTCGASGAQLRCVWKARNSLRSFDASFMLVPSKRNTSNSGKLSAAGMPCNLNSAITVPHDVFPHGYLTYILSILILSNHNGFRNGLLDLRSSTLSNVARNNLFDRRFTKVAVFTARIRQAATRILTLQLRHFSIAASHDCLIAPDSRVQGHRLHFYIVSCVQMLESLSGATTGYPAFPQDNHTGHNRMFEFDFDTETRDEPPISKIDVVTFFRIGTSSWKREYGDIA